MNGVMDEIRGAAKQRVQRLLLAEGGDERVVRAADRIQRLGIAEVAVVGAPDEVRATVRNADLSPGGVTVVDAGAADEIARTLKSGEVVIGADTVVVTEGKILGKPECPEDAVRMLRELGGRTHRVYTGVTVIDTGTGRILSEYECTAVTFGEMTEREIADYVETGEPLDKAGAYGIQGYGARFIKKIDGCYFNVVGLPLNRLYAMLKTLGCY
jgi:septum formation protein